MINVAKYSLLNISTQYFIIIHLQKGFDSEFNCNLYCVQKKLINIHPTNPIQLKHGQRHKIHNVLHLQASLLKVLMVSIKFLQLAMVFSINNNSHPQRQLTQHNTSYIMN